MDLHEQSGRIRGPPPLADKWRPTQGHGLMQNSKAKMKTSNLEEIRLVVTDRRPTQESGEGRTETIKMKRF
jgi:hypothetical protein